MSAIKILPRKNPLTPERFAQVIESFRVALHDRVSAACVFGSAGTPQMTVDSDIDLILVANDVNGRAFVERGLEFVDLYVIFPALDLLVYTPEELTSQLADSQIGFWKSVRESMKRFI